MGFQPSSFNAESFLSSRRLFSLNLVFQNSTRVFGSEKCPLLTQSGHSLIYVEQQVSGEKQDLPCPGKKS